MDAWQANDETRGKDTDLNCQLVLFPAPSRRISDSSVSSFCPGFSLSLREHLCIASRVAPAADFSKQAYCHWA